MRASRSILSRRRRKKINETFELNITSLLDAMVIILVFMLKSATVSAVHFSIFPGQELPMSKSPEIPPEVPQLVITPEAMIFEQLRILDFVQSPDSLGSQEARYEIKRSDLDENGRLITPLYQALLEVRRNFELLRAKGQGAKVNLDDPFYGEIAIQADKRVNYEMLRKVMYTAGAAGYRVFHLIAIRREQ